MKHFLWLPLVFILMPTLSPAQTAEEVLKKVAALSQEGNHREAADLGKKALLTPQASTKLLGATVEALRNLDTYQEQEDVIEASVQAHPKKWDLLLQAGQDYQNLPHSGQILENKFQRGYQRWGRGGGGSQYVQTMLRDRVRSLQLLESAWKALPADASTKAKNQVLQALINGLSQSQFGSYQAWALQHLTDLTTLPDYDDQSGLDSPATGYPVDTEGNPVYYKAAASWETAQNDAGRLLWLIQEQGKLSPLATFTAKQTLADLAKTWFSVRTLAGFGFRFNPDETESAKRDSIAALHTLKDEETVVNLATGPKRLTLPSDWSFMKLYEALAKDNEAPGYLRVSAWTSVAEELTDRRQYPRAVEAFQSALALETNTDSKRAIEYKIHQITDAQGNFDPQQPQAAGTEAKLSLTFRNAEKINLSARQVDVAKLLADTEAYLRTSPQDRDWQKIEVSNIGQRLLEKEGQKYLIGEAVTWEQKLEPRQNHWDRRVSVDTPLKQAGAWLVEGSFEGGHKTRALLWLESLVIVHTNQAKAGHYYIADAVTGAPVAGATVRFFGYRSEWTRPALLNSPQQVYSFKDFQLTSDQQGQVKVTDSKVNEYQWLIQAQSGDGKLAYLGFEGLYFGGNHDRFDEQTRLYTITDRPVYRPGQEVKWKAWARQVGYDPKIDTNKFAGASIEVVISSPRGEELLKKTYQADDSGAINDVMILDEEATLGQYQIRMTWNRTLRGGEHLGQHSFRVEEYKKPEFEVKVDAPSTPVALGDSFEIKVKADYYFGGPVKQGKVKYKVQRSAHTDRWFPIGPWDWLFGEGYGWRAHYYSWYPGSEKWCFCIPRYPWVRWHSNPPELVAEGESPLNADGTFTVKIDTALAKELHGNEDHRYSIEAEVTDESRRTIFGTGSVLAARRPFEVYVSLDRGYYQAGEEGKITINARTLDGNKVTANGDLTLYRITYDQDGKPTEEAVHTVGLTLNEKNEHTATERLTFTRSGQYRVSAKLKDEAGHEIEGISFITARGEGFNEGKDYRFDDLELITQKDEYSPGEEVEITLNTNHPGSTVALFLRTQNGVYPEPIWIKLEGKSTTHRFTLSEADQPNIFLDAYTVSAARVYQVTRQIIVPPKKRIATVELTPDSATYLPGQGSEVKVKVKDQDGKPFVGKVVLTAYDKSLEYISGGSNQEDIRPFFWGWKRSHYPQIEDSLRALQNGLLKSGESWMPPLGVFGGSVADGEIAGLVSSAGSARSESMMFADSAAPMAVMAAPAPMVMAEAPAKRGVTKDMVAKKSEAPGNGATIDGEDGPQPMIRSNLADSAVWIADFTTDAEGQGEINFTLPDNLTTWKLRSWVMGSKTQVGEASVEVITRKNLMVRLQAPRFFVEKDEVVISANVHNELDVEQSVKAVLELEGGVLAFMEGNQSAQAPLTLPAHSEKRFGWRVKVTGEGEAKIRVKALAQKDSDAMEMTFPAYTHGMLKTDSWSLAIRPDEASGKLTLKVPAERKPEQSRLEIRYSPTLAMTLVDALPYLVDYPYGCTEQTLNRFVPTIITLGVLKDLGVDLKAVKEKLTNLNAQEIGKAEDRAKRWQGKDNEGHLKAPVFDEDEVKKMAKSGLKRLEAMRNSDGGWGW
ncbi:MAG: MG2 domain-containing protein, partial [Prosthecobacter sp.]|nr:MG2 domain-containing protein [Prosthecobacter sp.]